jgi:hypothetical protein
MLIIAHRGNTNGPNPERENDPNYILEAKNKGFDVEIDVWVIDGIFFLGHDIPQYKTNIGFLKQSNFWCHAKNLAALEELLKEGCCVFSHDKDDYVLTSKCHIWAYPGMKLSSETICVMPERGKYNIEDLCNCYGICTDYTDLYKNKLQVQSTSM